MKDITTDELPPDPDAIPDVTVKVQQGQATYRARVVGTAIRELVITVDDGQVTAETVRGTPLGKLRNAAMEEIHRRAMLLPRDIDKDLMLVARTREGGPAILADVVLGLAIAEQLSPDGPVEFFAERNGVSRTTAFRWKKAAVDAGWLTPQSTAVALSFWRQQRAREAEKARKQAEARAGQSA